MTVKDLIKQAAEQFLESDSPILDAQLLLGEVLGKDRTWLMTWDDAEVSEKDKLAFEVRVQRREAGEPIAHILGRKEFWGLELECNASTLIPRPETELLVEKALELALPDNAQVLDLGTGTGAIALALAVENPGWNIIALDKFEQALTLAKRNQTRLSVENTEFIASNWFSALSHSNPFDLIVSNPPYIDPESAYLLQGDLRYEPSSALVSGQKGLADIEFICQHAVHFLQPGGWLMIEHGFDQKDSLSAILRHNNYQDIRQYSDIAGLPRLSLGQMP